MIEDYPNTNMPPQPQGKLVLPPVYPEQQVYDSSGRTQQVPLGPQPMMRQTAGPAASANPFSKIRYYWHSDPAHKFLIIAVSLATIAGLIFTTFVSVAFAQLIVPQSPQQALSIPTPQGIANTTQPAETPTPDSGQASTTNDQPTPTPTLVPSPTPQPTPEPTPTVGQLTLDIISIPTPVNNNTTVQVVVKTSQPGTNLSLTISYNTDVALVAPSPNEEQANDNGIATFSWQVSILSTKRTVTANVTATANDQNGQQVRSKTRTVSINVIKNGLPPIDNQ